MKEKVAPNGFWPRFEPEYQAIRENFVTDRNLLQAIGTEIGDNTLSRLNMPDQDPKHAFSGFQTIMEACFGNEGYLLRQKPDKVERDRQLITRAYLLAEWAHNGQLRDSGVPYIEHPMALLVGWSGKKPEDEVPGLINLKVTAETIASALLHDVIEDSPITTDIISEFISPQVAETVDILTQVKKTQKMPGGSEMTIKDREETLLKIIRALIHYPEAIMIKIYDRMHNIATLKTLKNDEGKIDHVKQVNYATDTANIYIRLAQMMGLDWESTWLAERCTAVIDPAAHRDRLLKRIHQGREDYFGGIKTNEIAQQEIGYLNAMSSGLGIEQIEITKPSTHEILEYMGQRRTLEAEDFFLNMRIIVADETDSDQQFMALFPTASDSLLAFRNRAAQIAKDLLVRPDVHSPASANIGLIQATESTDDQARATFFLRFAIGERLVPMKITVVSRSQWLHDRGSLAYLNAMDRIDRESFERYYHLEELVAAAQLRHKELGETFALVDRDELTLDERRILIQNLLTTLSSQNITVVGIKGDGTERHAPIPTDATVAYYIALKMPGNFLHVNQVFVNGRKASLAKKLNMGDRVHCTFKRGSLIDLAMFLDYITTRTTEQAGQKYDPALFLDIAQRIDEFVQNSKQSDDVEERKRGERVEQALILRGQQKIAGSEKHFGAYSYERVKNLFPHHDPMTLLYHLGLNLVLTDKHTFTQAQVETVTKRLRRFWARLPILAIKVADEKGLFKLVSGKLDEVGLDIILNEQRYIPDVRTRTTNTIYLLFRFGTDVDHDLLQSAKMELEKLQDARILNVSMFSNERAMKQELGILS
ncbi:bifunctional (p)ppGpp synthetase/guanosine-3',5'-bis(diphosphate) 3'-pyrophosphohydrolase [Candidatus Microgenomates bacterium]|nr:MAG: bifunctional (p)ppGpp synthetase/guanosine-3',5'-bis(diphosphate) 3'-pyrophosphohydrolase [Candidatus Microgenomates bacterium]